MSEPADILAPAVLERASDCFLWIVRRCPLCRRRHVHGGGALDGDPRELLFHRVAHCGRKVAPEIQSRGYVLIEEVPGGGDAV